MEMSSQICINLIYQVRQRCQGHVQERRRLGLGGKAKTFANNMPRAMALAWINSLYRLIKQICASTFYLKFYLNQTPRTPRDLQNRSSGSARSSSAETQNSNDVTSEAAHLIPQVASCRLAMWTRGLCLHLFPNEDLGIKPNLQELSQMTRCQRRHSVLSDQSRRLNLFLYRGPALLSCL